MTEAPPTPAPIMAAVIEGDFYSRLRKKRHGGSSRFHAIKPNGSFACGYELPPSEHLVPAYRVAADLRCRKHGCAQLFAAASSESK